MCNLYFDPLSCPFFFPTDVAENGRVLDLQDVFRRFDFDTICKISFGLDPCSLELDMCFEMKACGRSSRQSVLVLEAAVLGREVGWHDVAGEHATTARAEAERPSGRWSVATRLDAANPPWS
jgi:hypothetical protein